MDDPIVKSHENARQGQAGVGLRYVLVIGMALAVVAMALSYYATK